MEKWQSGAAALNNFFVLVQGGISNRPGTEYTCTSKQAGNPPKIIPFVYNNTQSYVLEFGDKYLRIISLGAYLTNADGSIYEVVTPYAITDVFYLRHAQSADVMTLTHPSYPAFNLSRLGQIDWTFEQISYVESVFQPIMTGATPTNGNAGNTGTTPGISSVTYQYIVTGVSDTLHSESLAEGDGWNCTNYNLGYYQEYGNYNTIEWNASQNAEYYNIYRKYAGQWGLIGTTTGLSFEDVNYSPDTENGPPANKNPFDGNNPVAVTYFQQRRVFAGSTAYPQTVWMSRSANYTNFDTHTPIVDDDAITATIASQQVNTIAHLVPMADLLVFTGAGIWKVAGGQTGEAITPSNFTATPQMFVGCSYVQPLAINSDVLFIEGKGSHIRDLQYDWYASIYNGNDLSVMADHLFYGYTISDWGFAQFPFNLLWACRSDGTLLGMTYLKEQNVWAWHQHSTTNGVFLSVAVVPEENDYGAIEDVAYFVVERTINGSNVYYIERLVTRQLGAANDDITKAWFVDCGLRYSGASVSSVSGLTHLVGQTVSACIDGKGYTGLTVASDGSVALPVAGETVTVGLPIAAHAQTLPLDISQPPQFARRKRISKVYASLYNSAGLQVSSNGGKNLYSLGNTATDGTMTSDYVMRIPSSIWTQKGQFDFYQNAPLPCTLTTISFDVEEGN
ncbi:hypothetical protein JK166_00160 [Gluconobacter kondonii]|nr:hypothetical protein [Gluconobacter kondonii]